MTFKVKGKRLKFTKKNCPINSQFKVTQIHQAIKESVFMLVQICSTPYNNILDKDHSLSGDPKLQSFQLCGGCRELPWDLAWPLSCFLS